MILLVICNKQRLGLEKKTTIENGIMVTHTMKTPEEVLSLPSLFAPLPARLVRSRMPLYEFKILKMNVNDKIKRSTWLFDNSLDEHSRDNKKDLKDQFERAAATYVLNICSEEFLKDYGEELAGFGSANERLDFLTSIFGEESDEEKVRRNKAKFEGLSRRSECDEKFSVFLKKLESCAAEITQKPDAINYIVDSQFRKSLSPELLCFLRDNTMINDTPAKIAEFLDARGRNVAPVQVAQIGLNNKIDSILSTTTELIAKSNFSVEEQIGALKEEHKKAQNLASERANDLMNLVKNLTATVSKIQTGPDQARQRQNFPPQNAPVNGFVPNNFYPQQPNNGFSQRPRFCNYCKNNSHYRSNCPFVTCFSCGLKGHMRNNCPGLQNQSQKQPSNNGNPQNEPAVSKN